MGLGQKQAHAPLRFRGITCLGKIEVPRQHRRRKVVGADGLRNFVLVIRYQIALDRPDKCHRDMVDITAKHSPTMMIALSLEIEPPYK